MVNTYRFGLGSPFVFLRCALDLKRRCSESREMMRPCAHKTLQWHHFWKHDSFSSENRAETAAGIRMCSGALQRSSVLCLFENSENDYTYLFTRACLYTRPFFEQQQQRVEYWSVLKIGVSSRCRQHAHLQQHYSSLSTWKIILMWANCRRNLTRNKCIK